LESNVGSGAVGGPNVADRGALRDEPTGVADFLAVEDVAPDRGAVRDEEGEGVERCDVEVAVDELPCC
jgi:hypothetical protein